MSPDEQIRFLSQLDNRSIIARVDTNPWVTVYRAEHPSPANSYVFCALVPTDSVQQVLGHDTWDLHIGNGLPGCGQTFGGDEPLVTYYRYGRSDGIEPLVFCRDFHGIKPAVIEILEEYRHFHNLHHDTQSGTYLRIEDSGHEDVVVKVTPDKVEFLLRPLRQFLAIKRMHLVLYYDIVRFSPLPIDQIPDAQLSEESHTNNTMYRVHIAECDWMPDEGWRTFSRLLGKRSIPPLPVGESGIWPYAKPEHEHCEFIIGRDSDGRDVRHTCDPSQLGNPSGKNVGAPNFLTPIYFKREVLKKYYDQPDKYSVDDGSLWCGTLWMLRMDNNHPTHVVVFLGDLGETLEHEEQLHWLHYNVAPEGGISRVAWTRGFQAEPTDPERCDLLFVQRFREIQDAWKERYGWHLFLPLKNEDLHYIKSIHVPVTKELLEFEQQILALSKILVDSLNIAEVSRSIPGEFADEKPLTKFEKFHELRKYRNRTHDLALLRDIQDLRSSGVAHRKGDRYHGVAARIGVTDNDTQKVFEGILSEAITMLEELRAHYLAKAQ